MKKTLSRASAGPDHSWNLLLHEPRSRDVPRERRYHAMTICSHTPDNHWGKTHECPHAFGKKEADLNISTRLLLDVTELGTQAGNVDDCSARRVLGSSLRACKWIFCALHFCEGCLLAALTISAVPAVIDEPGGTLHPPAEEEGRERTAAPSFLMTFHAWLCCCGSLPSITLTKLPHLHKCT